MPVRKPARAWPNAIVAEGFNPQTSKSETTGPVTLPDTSLRREGIPLRAAKHGSDIQFRPSQDTPSPTLTVNQNPGFLTGPETTDPLPPFEEKDSRKCLRDDAPPQHRESASDRAMCYLEILRRSRNDSRTE
jgi:hypothetical protein